MNITEFLEARIGEDEKLAKGATPGPWTTMVEETGDGENIYYTVEYGTEQLCDMALTSRQGWRDAEHIARHDPARVLAECAAKRAIIAEWEDPETFETFGSEIDDGYLIATDKAVRALAAVYKDHPDYQQEWAPNAE